MVFMIVVGVNFCSLDREGANPGEACWFTLNQIPPHPGACLFHFLEHARGTSTASSGKLTHVVYPCSIQAVYPSPGSP